LHQLLLLGGGVSSASSTVQQETINNIKDMLAKNQA
jgi:hypothetical protein